MTRRSSGRDSASTERAWSSLSRSSDAYSGPISTTASTAAPLAGQDVLGVACGVPLPAAADSGEGKLARVVGVEAQVGGDRLSRDRRCRPRPSLGLARQRLREVIRQGEAGACHTCIPAPRLLQALSPQAKSSRFGGPKTLSRTLSPTRQI
jgi:hypothetical protein